MWSGTKERERERHTHRLQCKYYSKKWQHYEIKNEQQINWKGMRKLKRLQWNWSQCWKRIFGVFGVFGEKVVYPLARSYVHSFIHSVERKTSRAFSYVVQTPRNILPTQTKSNQIVSFFLSSCVPTHTFTAFSLNIRFVGILFSRRVDFLKNDEQIQQRQ